MADIDKRAMMGLCAYSTPTGRQFHGTINVLWCRNPVGNTDPLLCEHHAVILRRPEQTDEERRLRQRESYHRKHPIVRRKRKPC